MKLKTPFSLIQNEENTRKIQYLTLVYCVGIFVSGFYTLKYSFQYQIYSYNYIVIPLLILCGLAPLVGAWKNSFKIASLTVWASLSLSTVVFIYAAGGLKAPGSFWLIAIPVTSAILFDKKGVIISLVLLLCVSATLYVLELKNMIPMELFNSLNFNVERITNLVTFLFYIMANILYFANTEEESIRKISESRADTENLLRVLIHDVASPLTVIKASGVILQKAESLNERQENSVKRILKASDVAYSILEKIRLMRSVTDGKAAVVNAKVDLLKVIKTAIQLNIEKLEKKEIKVIYNPPEESLFVYGDEILLTMVVFSNLISNAVKFTPHSESIEIRILKFENVTIIEVADHGIGMPAELMKSVFLMGVKTTRLGTDGEVGTGYGLPLANEYLQKMEGQIFVNSTENASKDNISGTVFTVTLKNYDFVRAA